VFTPPASPIHFAAADPFGRRFCIGITTAVKPRAEAIQMLHAIRPERDKPYFGTLHVDTDLNLLPKKSRMGRNCPCALPI
jgi:hypothetical protein